MKILHISKKFPQALGGDAVVVSNLRQQQQAAGHEVLVLTSNCDEITEGPGIYKFGLRDTPAKLDSITPRRIISLAMLFFKVFAILREECPDVVHTHSVDIAFAVSLATRLYQIPVIHTFHILTFYDRNQPAIRRKTELLLARAAGLRAVTVPNRHDAKLLRQAGFARALLLPNGVDLDFWQNPSAREQTKSTAHRFVFLTFGRLEHQKGYDFLVRAVARMKRELAVPFGVIVVGEGSQRPQLDKLARTLRVEDSITFVGRKSPTEIRQLLHRSDAVVFPSLYETTPLTVLEAWAAGMPVVVTSVGILRDVPADFDAAYVVPPGDHTRLAKAMQQCVVDAGRRAAVAASGYREVTQYSWPRIARKAEAIYKRSM